MKCCFQDGVIDNNVLVISVEWQFDTMSNASPRLVISNICAYMHRKLVTFVF